MDSTQQWAEGGCSILTFGKQFEWVGQLVESTTARELVGSPLNGVDERNIDLLDPSYLDPKNIELPEGFDDPRNEKLWDNIWLNGDVYERLQKLAGDRDYVELMNEILRAQLFPTQAPPQN